MHTESPEAKNREAETAGQERRPNRLWRLIRKFINVSVAPFVPLNSLRIWLYRRVGYSIGKSVFVGMMCYLDDTRPERMVIEDEVVISYRVTFICHGPGVPFDGKIILRRNCYLGAASTLVSPVEIGESATVGAGAVVVKNVPELTTVVGVPARVIRQGVPPWGQERD